LMPPPGLGALCGTDAAEAWLSPCSTTEPSPTFGAASSPSFAGSLSPWVEAFDPSRSRFESEEFANLFLPEPAFYDVYDETAFVDMTPFQDFQFLPPFIETNTKESEFKLTGMEDLQHSLANLFCNFSPTTDGGSSTVTFPTSDEDSSLPSTPHNLEDNVPLPPPPGLVLAAETAAEPSPEEVAPVPEIVPKKGWVTEAPKDVPVEEMQMTSVMVQNVSRKCTRDLLANTLIEAGFSGDFDFIFVTADLKQRNCGSGSALVNFRSEEACARFTAAFHKNINVATSFPGFVGKKAIEVTPAPIQGLDANVRKLEKSTVLMSILAERPGWQPARYDGAGQVAAEIGTS